jgi:hypothetical protein
MVPGRAEGSAARDSSSSVRRAAAQTRAPRRANHSDRARPSPLDAPVTRTLRGVSFTRPGILYHWTPGLQRPRRGEGRSGSVSHSTETPTGAAAGFRAQNA